MTLWSRLAGLRRWETLLVALLIVLLAWGTARSSFFLDGSNFTIASSTFMERALMALPMTLIIIAGEIDLSVASILGLSSAVLGITYAAGVPLWLAVILALVTGAACGLLNGLLVTRFGLPSLVVTLGTLALFRGLAFVILGGPQGQIAISNYPADFTRFGFGTIPGTVIPWSVILFVALLAAFVVLLHRSWIGFIEDELAKPGYEGITLVETAYGDDNPQLSYDKTIELLTAYPDLKGIISPTTVGMTAAAQAIAAEGRTGEVQLTGLNLPNLARDSVKDGTVQEFALWNPEDLGYLAYYTAAALINGEITGAEGDTFEAGRLGSYTVGADGVILLGPPFVFNADNIDDFDF